jgi:hypothetical protein
LFVGCYMISIIIRAEASATLLIETLNPLVEGVIKGLVGKLYIVARPKRDEIAHISEEAGTVLIEAGSWDAGLKLAAHNAPSDWVLLIDCGVIVESTLWVCIERHIKLGIGEIAITAPKQSFVSLLYKLRGKISLDQVVLMRTETICNSVFGISFGQKLCVMPTNAHRLRF